MDEKIIEIMNTDIERCKNHMVKEGSYQLYQSLVGKYNGYFQGFSKDIPTTGKMSTGGPSNYLPELNAIREKLEFLVVSEQTKDPLYKFKQMINNDLKDIKIAVDDINNENSPESAKQNLYADITAKYHPIVSKFSEGLYCVYAEQGVYEEVSGESLHYNLNQIYNKLFTFQTLNYPGLVETMQNSNPNTVINNFNTNENNNLVQITFEETRKSINGMTSLPDEDIEEIQKKINELEKIVNSEETKNKKWSKAKDIVKWVADKGVDVGIALLPLVMRIS